MRSKWRSTGEVHGPLIHVGDSHDHGSKSEGILPHTLTQNRRDDALPSGFLPFSMFGSLGLSDSFHPFKFMKNALIEMSVPAMQPYFKHLYFSRRGSNSKGFS